MLKFIAGFVASSAIMTTLALKPTDTHAQAGAVVSTATTAAGLEMLSSKIDKALESARQTGDYVTAIALVRAKDALDAFKVANLEILDKAETVLDRAAQTNLGRIRTLVADLDDRVKNRLETAEALTLQANQLVASLPGGRPFVAGFSPRVAPPNAQQSYTLQVRGVSLDVAEVKLPAAKSRRVVGPQELQFTIGTDTTPADDTTLKVYELPLTYKQPAKGFWAWLTNKMEEVQRQLPVVVMPRQLASYTVEGQRTFTHREVRDKEQVYLGEFKGENTSVLRVALPPEGWRWDVSDKNKFRLITHGGIQGRCEEIMWNGATGNGVEIRARLDRIGPSKKYPFGAPGRVSCSLEGPAYRESNRTEAFPARIGTFGWTGDHRVAVPEDASTLVVRVKLFDGRSRVFSGPGADTFFELQTQKGALIFVPKVPASLLASN
jgi:hypothetical protein